MKPSKELNTLEEKLEYVKSKNSLKENIEVFGLREILLKEEELEDHTITLEEYENIIKLKSVMENEEEYSKKEVEDFLKVEDNILQYVVSDNKNLEKLALHFYCIGYMASYKLIETIVKMQFFSTLYSEKNPKFSEELDSKYKYLNKRENETEQVKINLQLLYTKALGIINYKYNFDTFKENINGFLKENEAKYNFDKNYMFDYLDISIMDDIENAKNNTMAYKYLESELETLAVKYDVSLELTNEMKKDIEIFTKGYFDDIRTAFKETNSLNDKPVNIFNLTIDTLLKARLREEEAEAHKKPKKTTKKRVKKVENEEDSFINQISSEMKKVNNNEKANPIISGWVKVKSDAIMTEIHENRQKLGNYEDKKKYFENKIKELELKENPTEEDLEGIKYYKGQKEAVEEEELDLKKQLEDAENNIKILTEKILNTEEEQEKKNLEALLKYNKASKDSIIKRLNPSNKALKINIDEELEVESKNVKGIIPLSTYDISNYSELGEYFLEYAENQLYYMPDNKYIYIDPKAFTEYIGRNPSSYRVVKKQLLKDLNNMYENERYTLKKKVFKNVNGEKIELSNAKFSLISDILPMKIGRKEVILVALGETCKYLITTNDNKKWASIPYYLNQLTKENNTAKLIGKWLYKDIRRNLRGSGDYQRTLTFKSLVDTFISLGYLKPREQRYSEDVILKLEDALTSLSGINSLDIKFITYETEAFNNYRNLHKGKKEKDIKEAFEEEKITITFHTIDTESYDTIRKEKERYRKKTLKEKYSARENKITKISKKEYDSYLEKEGIEK